MEEEERKTNKELLENFLADGDTQMYLQKKPSTRHEAWLLGNVLVNLNLLDEVRDAKVLAKKKKNDKKK